MIPIQWAELQLELEMNSIKTGLNKPRMIRPTVSMAINYKEIFKKEKKLKREASIEAVKQLNE